MCFENGCTNSYAHLSACIASILLCLFYLFLSSVLLQIHIKNFMANRTTNERFSKRGKKVEDSEEGDSNASSTIMTLGDFDSPNESQH
mmetsp:Transcript_30951/g.47334  ORF Transcript_30951/g.47334 Transcript_30951/m.47334 type:complete len:88 (+) Transcript_30951:2292-2555(+)